MNYLAHAVLSGLDEPEFFLGNFTADSIKGRGLEQFPKAMAAGIRFHRAIDAFTDSHPLVKEFVKYLPAEFRRFGFIIADISFDYILSQPAQWQELGPRLERTEFVSQVYQRVESQRPLLPAPFHRVFAEMRRQDWLNEYASFDGLDRTFRRVATRLSRPGRFAESAHAVHGMGTQPARIFTNFFPQLTEYCATFRQQSNYFLS